MTIRKVLTHARTTVLNTPVVRGAQVWSTVFKRRADLPQGMRQRFMLGSWVNGMLLLIVAMNLTMVMVPFNGSTLNRLYAIGDLIVLVDVLMWVALAPRAYLAVLRQSPSHGRRWWGLA